MSIHIIICDQDGNHVESFAYNAWFEAAAALRKWDLTKYDAFHVTSVTSQEQVHPCSPQMLYKLEQERLSAVKTCGFGDYKIVVHAKETPSTKPLHGTYHEPADALLVLKSLREAVPDRQIEVLLMNENTFQYIYVSHSSDDAQTVLEELCGDRLETMLEQFSNAPIFSTPRTEKSIYDKWLDENNVLKCNEYFIHSEMGHILLELDSAINLGNREDMITEMQKVREKVEFLQKLVQAK